MHIHTVEENYDYRMKQIMEKMVDQYDELKDLDPDDLYEKIWNDYAKEFGHAVLEDMYEFAGDDLFEIK